MSRDEIKQTIDDFLSLIEKGCGSTEENEAKLAFLLDKLAFARHFAEYEDNEKDRAEAPRKAYEDVRMSVTTQFPRFGFYNLAKHVTENVGEGRTMVGDAIDDITDMTLDLFNVQWLWENNSPSRGLWYFEFSFASHWSWHLRGLQTYLLNG